MTAKFQFVRHLTIFLAVLALVNFFVNCAGHSGDSPTDPSNIPNSTPSPAPLPKGNRFLGIHVSEAERGFDSSFEIAKRVHFDYQNLLLFWGQGSFTGTLPFEPLEVNNSTGCLSSSTYSEDNPNSLVAIAKAYYPAHQTKLMLTLATYDTNLKLVPSCANAMRFNSSTMKTMFQYQLAKLFALLNQSPQLELVSLNIGNEIDAHADLAQCQINGAISQNWLDYIDFVNSGAAMAKSLRPNLKVGVVTTFYGTINPANKPCIDALLKVTDMLTVTYYPIDENLVMKPLSVVSSEIDTLTSLYPNTPIYFSEAGYSSGNVYIHSSLDQQAQFVSALFTAWDKHASQIKALSFLNLHESSDSAVDGFGTKYGFCPGSKCNSFKEYLKTLGLRTWPGDGSDKPAFTELIRQTQIRNW